MMGMDPVTIGLGISAATGLYGAISGNKAQDKAQQQAQMNYQQQQQWQQQQNSQLMGHNQQMQNLIMPYLTGQQGSQASPMNSFLYGSPGAGGGPSTGGMSIGQGMQPGGANLNRLAGDASMQGGPSGMQPGSRSEVSGSNFNSGQDGLMQMMQRGGPGYQDDPQTAALLRQLSTGGMQYGSKEADAALSGIAGGQTPMFDPRLTSAITQGATQGYGMGDPAAVAAMQRAAGGNTGFDTSQAYAAMRGQTNQDLNDQIAQLHGSAGSLGQRFGSSLANNEADLRARATVGLNNNMAQLGQQSWEASQGRALQGAQGLFGQGNAMLGFQQQAQGMLGQQQQAAMQARMGAAGQLQQNAMGQNQLASQQALGAASQLGGMNAQRNQFAQQNAQGQLGYAQLIGQLLGQQQGQNQSYNLGLLGMLNGQQSYLPSGAPQQQIMQGQNQLPDALGNIGNMAMMYPFLQQMMGGGGGGGMGYGGFTGGVGIGTGGGIPSSLFGGVRF